MKPGIEFIVHQELDPKTDRPPVRLKNEELIRILINQPSLAAYDKGALI
jgi:hypothetical protein